MKSGRAIYQGSLEGGWVGKSRDTWKKNKPCKAKEGQHRKIGGWEKRVMDRARRTLEV